jgi:hypothetical protein
MGVRGRRNQSELHESLAKETRQFLLNISTARGIIWRQEHTLHNGMRPDAVGFCSLQIKYEEKFQARLIDYRSNERVTDFMFVFEAKASYPDFKNTFNGNGEYKEKPYANFHFLVVPKGLSENYDLSTLPHYWGILEQKRKALHIIRIPKYIELNRIYFLESAYSMLFKLRDSIRDEYFDSKTY